MTIGVVDFVPTDERAHRVAELLDRGAAVVVSSWRDVRDLLLPLRELAPADDRR